LNEIIQNEMNEITDWLNANKVSINTEKQNLFFLDKEIRILMVQ
jgi:hypothetical protein